MMHKLCPVFLISLPRSGSTLLQKMLTVGSEIHSVSEPWLMLPLAFMLREKDMLATYSHKTASCAIEDFIANLPHGQKDFNEALEDFSISLYNRLQPPEGTKYFLDKTPRYYLIVPFLAEVFPTAKFIFVFRNPLEVLSSILTTWMNNRLKINLHYIDLFHGPHALSSGYDALKNRSVAVNYGDLVTSPEVELRRICAYLQIPFDPAMIAEYRNIEFSGRMGDQKGVKEFHSISTASLEKWKRILNTHYRKWFAKRYVRSLGDKTLMNFGTSVKELTHAIDCVHAGSNGNLRDMFHHLESNIRRWVFVDYYKRLYHCFMNKERFYPYI